MTNVAKFFMAVLAVGVLFSAQAYADDQDAQLLAALRRLYPTTSFSNVAKTPVQGIFEVTIGRKIAYTDASGKFFFVGSLFDVANHEDLSAPRREALERIDTKLLPLADTFKHASGTGQRTVYLFSDPDCPFCRNVQSQLEKIPNLTIVVFEYPLTSIHPDSERKALAIWCAKDNAARWDLWRAVLLENKSVEANTCPNPISRNIALGEALGIQGTPTLVADDGRRLAGMASSEKIEKWLTAEQK